MDEVIVKYFSARIFRTVDSRQMFESIFERFGECEISLTPMGVAERASASEICPAAGGAGGIVNVKERFWIFLRDGDAVARQPDLEREIVRLGLK